VPDRGISTFLIRGMGPLYACELLEEAGSTSDPLKVDNIWADDDPSESPDHGRYCGLLCPCEGCESGYCLTLVLSDEDIYKHIKRNNAKNIASYIYIHE